MISAAPTILALQPDSAWMVILLVSLITLPAVLLLHRLINRPGGLVSGMVLGLPLLLPPIVALIYHHSAFPEVAVLRPAAPALLESSPDLPHLLLLSYGSNELMTLYALSGWTGTLLPAICVCLSSLMLLRRLLGHAALRRALKSCRPASMETDEELVSAVARLSRAAGLKQPPSVFVDMQDEARAFATGGTPARIVISETLLTYLEGSELEALVAHEIAHIRARDVPLMVWAGILRDVLAWNPVAHVTLRHLANDREFEADREAAALTGGPLAVASGLVKMCELTRFRKGLLTSAGLGFLRPRRQITRRVSRLIGMADDGCLETPASRIPYVMAVCLAVVLALQVGVRLSEQEMEAWAVIWGTRPASEAIKWEPRMAWGAKLSSHATGKRATDGRRELSKAALRRRVLMQLAGEAIVLEQRDFSKWMDSLAALAVRQGLSRSHIRRKSRQDWQAVPVFSERAESTFGIYQIRPLL